MRFLAAVAVVAGLAVGAFFANTATASHASGHNTTVVLASGHNTT